MPEIDFVLAQKQKIQGEKIIDIRRETLKVRLVGISLPAIRKFYLSLSHLINT